MKEWRFSPSYPLFSGSHALALIVIHKYLSIWFKWLFRRVGRNEVETHRTFKMVGWAFRHFVALSLYPPYICCFGLMYNDERAGVVTHSRRASVIIKKTGRWRVPTAFPRRRVGTREGWVELRCTHHLGGSVGFHFVPTHPTKKPFKSIT